MMTFRYAPTPTPAHLHALTGQTQKGRPLIPLIVFGPSGSFSLDGLLDTGFDWTVFPLARAAQLGVDLDGAVVSPSLSVGGQSMAVSYLPLSLRVSDGVEIRRWTGLVGFAPLSTRYALLGTLGFLEFFSHRFFPDLDRIELEANSRYRGT
ncbi:MAG: hypothetical protein K2W96_18740 [Gemmataceae bacterium]|nr:hypothetical protein [Gemmataceae bacterium]